jgi:hypothetical protein
MVIRSKTETLIADISKIDLLIILNYITSLLLKEYILDFVSHVVDLKGCSTSFVKGLAYLLTSFVINQQPLLQSSETASNYVITPKGKT